MDLLTRTDVEQLTERGRADTHLSLFIPTHVTGADTRVDAIRWKNLVFQVEDTLVKRGMGREEIDELLGPAVALREDSRAWRYMSDGLAMFLRPGWNRTFRVPVDVPEIATVGDQFVVSPLAPLFTGDSHFLLLVLSQRRVRLLEGSRQRVEEIELGEVPTSLRSVIEPPDPRSDTMTSPNSSGPGSGGAAVFYGHGAADNDFKKNEVRSFLRQVAEGLHQYLAGQNLPMVLVGLDEMQALYAEVNQYPHVLKDTVRQNPDQLSAEELHAAAWPIIEATLDRERAAAIERFEELHGTGLSTGNPDKIEEATQQGRVDTLFMAAGPGCWEQPADSGPVVQLGVDQAFAHCELLDRASMDTLSTGGRLFTVPAEQVPGGGDVAAILRY